VGFALTVLQRRLASSPEAILRSVERRLTEGDLDDLTGDEREQAEETVVDASTAATTLAELDKEIAVLADLEELARRVRHAGTDTAWTELRGLLLDEEPAGRPSRAVREERRPLPPRASPSTPTGPSATSCATSMTRQPSPQSVNAV
jgi:hypothetical protein